VLDFADFELLAVELLLVASVVAIAARYLRLPYTVALVVAGFVLSFGRFFEVTLSRELILLVFLPPLLFEAAVNMDLEELRRRAAQVGLLAIAGTIITAATVALALVAFTGLRAKYAVLLAVMLSPTDPVSVLATMKEHGVAGGLRTLLEGESIFNDALGIVLFTIALSVAFPEHAGDSMGWWGATTEFAAEVGIGVAVGAAGGLLIHHLMRLLDDHLVEITLSVALAFGSFLLADRAGGSGVMAVVASGLLIGNYGTFRAMSASSRRVMVEFWDVVTFLINSALFLLIGLEFRAERFGERETILAAVVASLALFAGRAASVYGLLLPFRRRGGRRGIPGEWVHAVYWGGLRGSIPIALVLGLTAAQRDLDGADAVAVVFGAVFVSLLLQGLTFAPLLDRLRLSKRGAYRGRRSAHSEA
jgi:CPA1 family monovalent cation:H+ antiporter